MRRIFLLSSERSGSNLLRSLMERNADVAAPPAAQLLKALLPHCAPGAMGQGRAPGPDLLERVVALTRVHPLPWAPAVTADDVLERLGAGPWGALALFDAVYGAYAGKTGKDGYFVKENNVFDFAPLLAQAFPEAGFVYLVRDPRDVFLSFKKVPGGPNLARTFAPFWCREQERCIGFLEGLGGERGVTVRYEDLIEAPDAVMASLKATLGLAGAASAGSVNDAGAVSTGPYFKNLGGEVLRHNKQKYVTGLTAAETRLIEVACADLMGRLGYPRDGAAAGAVAMRPAPGVPVRALDRAMSGGKALYMLRPREILVRIRRHLLYRDIRRACR